MKRYFIKRGYRRNRNPVQYQDSPEDALTYQIAVYRYAAQVIASQGFATVLDVGCGLGLKLGEFIVPTGASVTGVDARKTISICIERNAFGRWFADDIERPRADLGGPFDLIICADVIEHLRDPDTLFGYFRRWSHPKTHVLLSTPERDLRRGPDDMGPPGNPAHIREWNQEELRQYLESQGLTVLEHSIVELRTAMETCQLAFCSWAG
ncbi:class I SAM-dependent methyltransferase [Gemmatimonadota bacterium]